MCRSGWISGSQLVAYLTRPRLYLSQVILYNLGLCERVFFCSGTFLSFRRFQNTWVPEVGLGLERLCTISWVGVACIWANYAQWRLHAIDQIIAPNQVGPSCNPQRSLPSPPVVLGPILYDVLVRGL